MRSAVFLPMPFTDARRFALPSAMASWRSPIVRPESTASASFGPTPETVVTSSNISRSRSVAKP